MEIRERAVAAVKAVSKHATCGKVGNSESSDRIGARLNGWCSGASARPGVLSARTQQVQPCR
jgi:hypothetical protein